MNPSIMLVSYQQPNAMESILETPQPFSPRKTTILHTLSSNDNDAWVVWAVSDLYDDA